MVLKMRLSENLQKFCDESSIHGVQYLGPSKKIHERMVWTIILGLFLTLSALVVHSLVVNWDQDPIVTTIGTTSHPIQLVPFPAVTICPNGFDVWGFAQR